MNEMNPQVVQENMQVPEDMQEPLERIVLAGKKVMFSPETADMVQEALAGEEPIEDRLAQAIAGLMGMLWTESNGTMPPQLIVPAAMILLAEAVMFLQEAGEEIQPQQYGTAIEQTINAVMEMAGVDDETLQAELGPGTEAPPAQGLIGGQMQ